MNKQKTRSWIRRQSGKIHFFFDMPQILDWIGQSRGYRIAQELAERIWGEPVAWIDTVLFGAFCVGLTLCVVWVGDKWHEHQIKSAANPSKALWKRGVWAARQLLAHAGVWVLILLTIAVLLLIALGSIHDSTIYWTAFLIAIAPLVFVFARKFILVTLVDRKVCDKTPKELMDIAAKGFSAMDGEEVEKHLGTWVKVAGVVLAVNRLSNFDGGYGSYPDNSFCEIELRSDDDVLVKLDVFKARHRIRLQQIASGTLLKVQGELKQVTSAPPGAHVRLVSGEILIQEERMA